MENEVKKRHEQILTRSFSQDLDLFLFEQLLKQNITSPDLLIEYEIYSCGKEIQVKYLSARQLSKYGDVVEYEGRIYTIKEMDEHLSRWYNENKQELIRYKNIFREKRFITLNQFEEFYGDTEEERRCYYCGITEKGIDVLIQKNRIYTKRLIMRGRTLEVDKKSANGKYDQANMVLCCYWCNNAKTDEFSHEEFMTIGDAIREIWKKRI